ncbi:Oxidoreductase htatip2 [Bulinus truncatus]|nr:Oxidoreductase htatip2 [Bulinus truncatus]
MRTLAQMFRISNLEHHHGVSLPSSTFNLMIHRMVDAADSSQMDKFRSLGHSAFVLGYTGEVGKMLVEELNRQRLFKRVVLIGRRQVPLDVAPEFEQKVIDFDKIQDHRDVFTDIDYGFCCLGTTRSSVGREGFIKVDRDYVLNSAEVAKSQGCKHFSLVSSMGSNKNSWFLYPKIKGEVEHTLSEMNFDRLSIYRPGLLLCDRQQSRPMEKVTTIFLKPITSFFPTLMSVPTSTVAMAMVNNVVNPTKNTHETYENKNIHLIAKGLSMEEKDIKN